MPVESDSDRAAFGNSAEFGLACTYQSAAATVALSGIFDEATGDSDPLGGGLGMLGQPPRLSAVRDSDVPADAAPGEHTIDVITIGDRRFAPRTIEPDGTGLSVIRMEELDA